MNNLACIKGILKGATALSDRELDDIINDLRSRQRAALKAQGGTQNAAATAAVAAKKAQELRIAAAIERANARRNAIIHRQILDEQTKYRDLPEWIEAQIAGSNRRVAGARDSVNAKVEAYKGKYLGGMVNDLRKAGVLGFVQARIRDMLGNGKGALDDKVAREMWEIGREGGKPGVTGSKEARAIADVFHKYLELSRIDQNRLGAFIGKLEGYIPQGHDMARINAMGFERWRTLAEATFGNDRTYQGLKLKGDASDAAKIDGFWRDVYTELSQGEFFRADVEGPLLGMKGPANIAKKASQHRTLHPNSADDWIKYNDEAGPGSLIEAVVGKLTQASRTAALMEKFGTNPRAMFERVVSDAREFALKKGQTIDKRLSRGGFTSRLFDVADGTVDIPANVSAAQISSALRAVQTWAKLGAAVLSSVPDVVTAAGEMAYQGENFFGALGRQFGEVIAQFGDDGARREMADLVGVGFDTIVRDAASRMTSADVAGYRATHKVTNLFFKLNLLSIFTDLGERATSSIMARKLGMLAGSEWKDVPGELANVLNLYGIGEREWNIIRRHTRYAVGGKEILAPDMLRDMPLKDIDDVIEWPLEAIRIEAARGLDLMQKKLGGLVKKFEALGEQLEAQGQIGEGIGALREARDYMRSLLADDAQAKRWSLRMQNATPDEIFRGAMTVAKEHERVLEGFRKELDAAVRTLKKAKDAEPGVIEKWGATAKAIEEAQAVVRGWPDALERQLDRRREEAIQALETKFRAYYADRTHTAVLRGGIREKTYTTQGAQAGTPYGEAVRFVMQFKQYSMSFVQKVLGRYAQEDRFWRIPGGLLRMPASEARQFATFIVTLTALGYLASAAKDIAKGRTPRDPRDPRTWGQAFVQGGGAGIYGDFLFSRVNRFGGGFAETLLGPTIGTGAEAADILLSGRDESVKALFGEDTNFPDVQTLAFFKNNTPFANLFYTRAALDYLILYDLQEMMSPGSLRRMERRLRDDQRQEFILPPSENRVRLFTQGR